MTALAVLSTGLFAALAAAAVSGGLPTLRRSPRRRQQPPTALLLASAGSPCSLTTYRLASLGLGILAGVVAMTVSAIPALAVVPVLLAGVAPRVWLRRRAAARVRETRSAWPDALSQLGGAVRAGRPLSHALVDLSLDGPDGLRAPLTGLAARIQTVGLVPALQAVADAVADPVTDRVVEVLCLAHTEGGRVVVDVLEDLAHGIADEVHTGEELDTLSLEGRLNARLVFAMPWVVLLLLTAQEGPFRSFYSGPAGTVVILVGAVVSLVGLVVVGRLSRVPAEPRVLRADGVAP